VTDLWLGAIPSDPFGGEVATCQPKAQMFPFNPSRNVPFENEDYRCEARSTGILAERFQGWSGAGL